MIIQIRGTATKRDIVWRRLHVKDIILLFTHTHTHLYSSHSLTTMTKYYSGKGSWYETIQRDGQIAKLNLQLPLQCNALTESLFLQCSFDCSFVRGSDFHFSRNPFVEEQPSCCWCMGEMGEEDKRAMSMEDVRRLSTDCIRSIFIVIPPLLHCCSWLNSIVKQ